MPSEDDNRSQQREGLRSALSRNRITGPLLRYGISILRLNRTRGLAHGNLARLEHLDRRIDDIRSEMKSLRQDIDLRGDDAQRQTDQLREKLRLLEDGFRQLGTQQTNLSQ